MVQALQSCQIPASAFLLALELPAHFRPALRRLK
jgi:hypothetical protein